MVSLPDRLPRVDQTKADVTGGTPDFSDTWIVIPLYNESAVIWDVLHDVSHVFPHVVCVDDGSRDGSADIVAAAKVAHLVRHPVNLGQGAAIQTGVEYARGMPGARYFVTFDADGQHQVSDVIAMVERLRNEPLDVVLGTRFGGAEAVGMPWHKRLVLAFIVRLSARARRLGLSDAHNGLRAFDKVVADQLDLAVGGMGHASEFVALIERQGWRVDEQPVSILYTDYSKAKGQSLLNGINIVVDNIAHGRSER